MDRIGFPQAHFVKSVESTSASTLLIASISVFSVAAVESIDERCDVCSVLAVVKKVATDALRKLLKLSRTLLVGLEPSVCAVDTCPPCPVEILVLFVAIAPPSELCGGDGLGGSLGP